MTVLTTTGGTELLANAKDSEESEEVARFLPALTSPAQARRFVRQSCPPSTAPEVLDTAVLLTSELVTNAVVHARSAVTVAVAISAATVQVAVTDDGEGVPVLDPATDVAERGRGLGLVRELSASWGVASLATGKTVWFTLQLPGRD
jgi:anti-sigma regulatory factor (Ser/Thr protein kinase)